MKIAFKNIIGINQKYVIQYRWTIDGVATRWTNYKIFKTKNNRNAFFEKLVLKNNDDFVEYKILDI